MKYGSARLIIVSHIMYLCTIYRAPESGAHDSEKNSVFSIYD